MKTLKRTTANAEAEMLRRLLLQTEERLVRIIERKQKLGYVDYAEQAVLERTQKELARMVSESWKYVPKMVRKNFYIGIERGAGKGYKSASDFLSNASHQQRRAMDVLINKILDILNQSKNLDEAIEKVKALLNK